MRKLFFALVSLCATAAFAQTDGFVVNDVSLSPGTTSELTIALNNSADYTAFQFDLELPEGVTILKNEAGDFEASLDAARKDNHVLVVGDVGSNTYRLLCYSMTNADLKGESGATLIHIKLSAAEDADMSGELKATLKAGLLVTSAAVGTEPESASGDITTIKLGDANNDGKVSILDAVTVVEYILEKNPTPFVFAAADMDHSGTVTILDAVMIIDVILKESAGARSLQWNQVVLDPQ